MSDLIEKVSKAMLRRSMSDLIERVSKAILMSESSESGLEVEPSGGWRTWEPEAKAAIAVVLKELDTWESKNGSRTCNQTRVAEMYASENGVNLDE